MRLTQWRCFACLLPFCLFGCWASGQITTVNGFNYFDLNEDAFSVDASCLGLSPAAQSAYEYFFTSLQLAETVDSLFYANADSADITKGDFRIARRPLLSRTLGGDAFRYVLIRPDDSISRPVVIITHGGKTGGADSRRILSLGTYDYVQRGYAVAFYQSGPLGNLTQTLQDGGFPNYCQYDWSPDDDLRCFECAVYLKYQLAVAATQYTVANATAFQLDTNRVFASGFSGGALGMAYLGLTDPGDFGDTLFAAMGSHSAISRFPAQTYHTDAIALLAGGVLDESSQPFHIGNVIDAGDTNTRYLLFHGQDDYAVQPETAPLFWSVPEAELSGSQIKTLFDLSDAFQNSGIPHKGIMNCSACHDIYTFPCDYKDDCVGNNPQFFINPGPPADTGECLFWASNQNFVGYNYDNLCDPGNDDSRWEDMFYVLSQIHDYAKISARYFSQAFPLSGPPRQPDGFVDGI